MGTRTKKWKLFISGRQSTNQWTGSIFTCLRLCFNPFRSKGIKSSSTRVKKKKNLLSLWYSTTDVIWQFRLPMCSFPASSWGSLGWIFSSEMVKHKFWNWPKMAALKQNGQLSVNCGFFMCSDRHVQPILCRSGKLGSWSPFHGARLGEFQGGQSFRAF